MISSGVPGRTDAGDHLARFHLLALLNVERRGVRIVRLGSIAVIDDDQIAVPALLAGELDRPILCGLDRRAPGCRDVETGVVVRRAAGRARAVAELGGDRSLDRHDEAA